MGKGGRLNGGLILMFYYQEWLIMGVWMEEKWLEEGNGEWLRKGKLYHQSLKFAEQGRG